MKQSIRKLLPLLLTIVIIVLVNAASTTLFFRFDLTRNKTYSISEASRQAVASLEEPLTIKGFFSSNLSAPYNNTEQVLRDLLDEYAIAGNRFFNFSITDMPSKSDTDAASVSELESEAREYRIYPIQIQNVEQDEVKLVTAYMGLAFIHGDMIETIPAVTSTENLEYVVTQIITKMSNKISALLSLKDNIDVTLILSSSLYQLGTSLSALPRDIENAVDELNQQYYGKLAFRHLDPHEDGRGDIYESEYGLSPLTLRTQTETGEISQKAYASLIVSLGTKSRSAGLISRGIFGYQISDIESLKNIIEQTAGTFLGIDEEIGYLVDYGTPPLDAGQQQQQQMTPQQPDMANFQRVVSQEYALQPVTLQEGIPEGLRSLIIAGPSANFSEYDLFQIDQHLMKGNSLLLFLDAFSIFVTQPDQYGGSEPDILPRSTGLERLLEHYGIRLKQSFVLDEESYKQRQMSANGGIVETPVYFAPLIHSDQMDGSFRFISNIPELIMLSNSPLEKVENSNINVNIRTLFSSSKDSWEMSEDINLNNTVYMQPPPDEMQASMDLAYIAEGRFSSYYADREVPVREIPEEDGTDQSEQNPSQTVISSDNLSVKQAVIKEGEGKIFILGSSSILGSNILDQDGQSANALFLLNLIDYMSGREDYAIMRTKGITYTPLKETSPQIRSFIKTFNIAGIAIIVVAIGVIVWFGRVSKKKKIQNHFRAGSVSSGGTSHAG